MKRQKLDLYDLRRRAFEGDAFFLFEVGGLIYHLAQRRHCKERDIDHIIDEAEAMERAIDADEKQRDLYTILPKRTMNR